MHEQMLELYYCKTSQQKIFRRFLSRLDQTSLRCFWLVTQVLSITEIFVFSKMLSKLAEVVPNEEINVSFKFAAVSSKNKKQTVMKHILASMEGIRYLKEFSTVGTSTLFPVDYKGFLIARFPSSVYITLT